METIYLTKEELDRLPEIKELKLPTSDPSNSSTKFVLIDGELGKIYQNTSEYYLNLSEENVGLLQDYKSVKEFNVPTRKVYCENKYIGCTQTFFEEAIRFEDIFKGFPNDIIISNEQYLSLFKSISTIVKYFHSRNNSFGDLSFKNILFVDGKLKFIDLEFCGMNGELPMCFSKTAADYFLRFNSLGFLNREEFDKISLIIEFLCLQFDALKFTNSILYGIPPYDYKRLYEYTKMNRLFKYTLEIVRNYFKFSDVKLPYLGDVIQNEDLYGHKIKKLSGHL